MSQAPRLPESERDERQPGQRPEPQPRVAVSPVAVVVGAGLVAAYCLIFWRAQTVLGKSIAGGLPPVWAVLALLMFSVLRPVWRRIPVLRRLTTRSILVVYALFMIGCRFMGVEQSLHYALLPHYLAETDSRMAEARELLPCWWVPRAPETIAIDFYEGRPDGVVDWGVWLRPIAVWSGFLLSCLVMAYCAYALFYRQWTRYERLSYPFLQLPLQILPLEDGSAHRLRDIKLFACGFALVAAFHTINILHAFNPSLPGTGAFISLNPLLTERPWDALRPLTVVFKFDILGFAYLIPAEVSLSAVLSFFTAKFAKLIAVTTGRDSAGFPFFAQLVVGGYVALTAHLVWVARRHLKRAARLAFSRGISPEEEENPMSYRAALFGFFGAVALNMAFLMASGIHAVAGGMWLILLLVFLIVTQRARAEVGVPIHTLHPVRWEYLTIPALLGPKRLLDWFGLRSCEALAGLSFLPSWGLGIGTGLHAEAIRLCDLAGVRLRSTALPALIAAAVGVVTMHIMLVSASYEYGWLSLGFRNALQNPVDSGPLRTEYAKPIDWQVSAPTVNRGEQIAFLVGAAVTVALILVRHVWLRFPVHPLGALLGLVPGTNSPHWMPLLVAGTLKRIIYNLGGLSLYRTTVPFFVGLGVGHFIVGGAFWGALTMVIPEDVASSYMVWFG